MKKLCVETLEPRMMLSGEDIFNNPIPTSLLTAGQLEMLGSMTPREIVSSRDSVVAGMPVRVVGLNPNPASGDDFTGLSMTDGISSSFVIQQPGNHLISLPITIVNDTRVEPTERFAAEVIPDPTYRVIPSPQVVTIVDDEWRWVAPEWDQGPTESFAGSFTVTLPLNLWSWTVNYDGYVSASGRNMVSAHLGGADNEQLK